MRVVIDAKKAGMQARLATPLTQSKYLPLWLIAVKGENVILRFEETLITQLEQLYFQLIFENFTRWK